MRFYLTSYKLGDEATRIPDLAPKNRRLALVMNALDYSNDAERRAKSEARDTASLAALGLEPEILDLRDYFDKTEELRSRLERYGVIWARGGSAYVLREAMKRSGFDRVLLELREANADLLYGGYSAGACVMGTGLVGFEHIDDANARPYGPGAYETSGLGIVPYEIVPHYRSDHFESEAMELVVQACIEAKVPFVALHDGETIIIA